VSERERLFITGEYAGVSGDNQKAVEIRELLVRMYPRDSIFHGNLASSYNQRGEYVKAAAEAEASIRTGPMFVQGYAVAVAAYTSLNRPAAVKVVIAQAAAAGLDAPRFHLVLLEIACVEKDQPSQARELQWLAGKPQQLQGVFIQADNALALGQPSKARGLLDRSTIPAPASQLAAFAGEIALLTGGGAPAPLSRDAKVPDQAKAPLSELAGAPRPEQRCRGGRRVSEDYR
jgi:hypothetical protein